MKYEKVIVLGSGFSKSFLDDMPVIKDLINDKLCSYENLYKHVNTIFKNSNIGDNVSSLQEKIINIENISTSILSKEFFVDEKEKILYKTLQFELLQLLYEEIHICEPINKMSNHQLNIFKSFIKYCIDNNIVIISFNYDLLIEEILLLISKKNKDKTYILDYDIELKKNIYTCYKDICESSNEITFDDLIPPSSNIFFEELNILKLLKPHGSFNWYRLKGSHINDFNSIYINWERPYKNALPVFIPISHAKNNFLGGSFFSTIWTRIIDYLEGAKEISFIGYGFPQTDISNMYMFLRYKQKIKDIVVYKEEEAKELESIFTNNVVHCIDAKEYIKSFINYNGG